VPGSEFVIPADLILLAMGFTGPRKAGMLAQSGVRLTDRGNVDANVADYRTSEDMIFACGDMRRGQSLVVWAIREGRQAGTARTPSASLLLSYWIAQRRRGAERPGGEAAFVYRRTRVTASKRS
jgi:hypothetical protein